MVVLFEIIKDKTMKIEAKGKDWEFIYGNGEKTKSVNGSPYTYINFMSWVIFKVNFIKLTLYSFMLRYNNIIVNQGKGIVTTLEHLKLFFLNKSAKIDGIPRSLTQYEKNKR